MIEDDEDIKDLECQRRHRAEVHSPGFMELIPDKAQPGLRPAFRAIGFHHVLSNRVRMWRIETEQYKVVVDTPCRPDSIFQA